jgi:hypothetical protein
MHTDPLYIKKGFSTSLLDSQGPNSQCVVDFFKYVQTQISRALDRLHYAGRIWNDAVRTAQTMGMRRLWQICVSYTLPTLHCLLKLIETPSIPLV